MHRDIRQVRDRIQAKLDTFGYDDDELLKQARDFAALELQALSRLELERGSYEGFVEFWEWLCSNVAEVSPKAARELIAVSEDIQARAKRFYGVGKPKEETD